MTSSLVLLKGSKRLLKPWLFPLGVVCIYGLGLALAPNETYNAIQISRSMLGQLALPLCLAVVMMAVLNRYLSPATITRFLGQKTGFKGIVLSSLAGILSMGPIYAWYPLFKGLKEKGVSIFIVANFIGCRSVKPVLLPVLVAYFGWRFASVFVLMSLIGALGTAYIVALTCSEKGSAKAG